MFYFIYFQSAHQDIESHAPVIKSLVQLCQEYSDKFLRGKKRRSKRRTSATTATTTTVSTTTTVATTTTAPVPTCPTVSIGQAIEQRWHQLWLRSLEWQCFLEQLLWKSKRIKKVSSQNNCYCIKKLGFPGKFSLGL